MSERRTKDTFSDVTKNAISGYGVIVLGAICFVLSLALVTTVVRIVVGVGSGSGA